MSTENEIQLWMERFNRKLPKRKPQDQESNGMQIRAML